MKLIILFLVYSSLSFSQTTELCDEFGNPISALTQIGVPNCLTPENVELATKKNDQSGICGQCRTQFQTRSEQSLASLDNKARKEIFIKASLEEYKKNLSNSLVEALKLRTLQPTGSTFQKSITSCKLKNIEELTSGCSSEVKKVITDSKILKDLNKEISNELGKLLSQDSAYSPEPTLLQRQQPACFISEKDLLLISSRSAEEALSSSMISALINLDPDDFGEVNQMFLDDSILENYEGDISELTQSLRSHPLLAEHIKTPKDFITFLKTVPSPYSTENLRAAIYSKAAGDKLDERLAQSCEKSFKAINKSLCSNDFESGKFNLDAFGLHYKIYSSEVPSDASTLAASETLLNKNAEMFKLCDNNIGNNKIGLKSTLENLNDNLRESYKDLSYNDFRQQKYKSEIGNLNTFVCTNSSRPCKEDTFECKVLQKYNDLKNSGSLESKLARSSNTDVNSLLRSMIGDTSAIEPKTKEILIANGIIPRDDGTIVAQPDIPERRPEFFAQENSVQNNGPVRTTVAQVPQGQGNRNNSARFSPNSGDSYSTTSPSTQSSNSESLADFSDILNDSSEDLQRMQDEIRRRLMDLPPEEQQNKAKVKNIVSNSSSKLGRRLTPREVNAVADRIVSDPASFLAPEIAEAPAPTTGGAQVSDTETQLEKWRNGQRDQALMGMAGAQQVLANDRSPASVNEEAPKDLTKIALNIPEDPKVKLSDVFYQKLNLNDSETQLLKVLMKNKSNFLLQVNSLNFRIIFSNNSFNLLLENGDSQEAERVRPQLEMFLRRLKS